MLQNEPSMFIRLQILAEIKAKRSFIIHLLFIITENEFKNKPLILIIAQYRQLFKLMLRVEALKSRSYFIIFHPEIA